LFRSKFSDYKNLGIKAYARRNREFFEKIKNLSLPAPAPANIGATIYAGIIAAVPGFSDGFDCKDSGFFLFKTATGLESRCTSALPVNLQEDIAGFHGTGISDNGSVVAELTADNSP